ncbi:MAG: hypothetical protein HZB91_12340 [Elusimicrobia bacterium]|nr:hypothetical protein [Elusimicrobiota bacterium]
MAFILSASAVLLNLALYGYRYGTDPNTAQVLPFIGRLMDPSLYPNDPYVASVSAFPSLYPLVMAGLGRAVPLPALHLGLYLAGRALFFYGVWRLARRLFPSTGTAVAAVFLAAVSPLASVFAPLGEDPLMKTSLYHTSLAAPMILLSLCLFLEERWLASFGLLAAGFCLHPLAAAHLAVLYLAVAAMSPRGSRSMPGWLLFLGVCVPIGWWWSGRGGDPGPGFVEASRAWYPGHSFPSAWGPERWRRAAVYVPGLMLFAAAGWKGCAEKGKVGALMAGMAALWACGWIFAELIPVPAVVRLQPLRSDAFFTILGLAFAAERFAGLVEMRTWQSLGLALLAGAGLTELTPPHMAPFALAVVLMAAWVPEAWSRGLGWVGTALCVWCAWQWPFALSRTLLLGGAFGLAAIGRSRLSGSTASRLALACGLVLIPLLPVIASRCRTLDLDPLTDRERDFRVAQDWARERTEPGDLFILPAEAQGWRVFSRRPAVVEWTDGAAFHWQGSYLAEWRRRTADMARAGWGTSPASREGLLSLADAYGASYALVSAGSDPGLPQAYANGHYAVVRLR